MSKTYTQELKEKINNLNDEFEIKSLENQLLLNEIEDYQTPNRLIGEQSRYLLDMLNELLEYEKKMPSERITASKKRLINLLHINTQLNNIMSYNHSKTLLNKHQSGVIQKLRIENNELRQELWKLNKIDSF